MKNQNERGLLQGLYDFGSNVGTTECLTHLELAMTNSAFGHQYALYALEDIDELDEDADEIHHAIESHKRDYFIARVKFESLDKGRLEAFESDLQLQKVAVFEKRPVYLH